MKKGLFIFPGILAMSLTACATGVKHNISEYIKELDYTSNNRILQLTDIHLGDQDDFEKHFKFMDLTINEANPDLIVVTGDLFTFASKSTAKRLFSYLDSKGKPWTVTFGNHDEQCYFSVDWLTSLLNNYGSNCVFIDKQDDNVQGNANFAINLMKTEGGVRKIHEQLIIMDSNRYYFGSYMGYDYFKQNQIDWYKELVNYTTEQNGGVVVPSLMFYHIPLPEVYDAWDKAQDGSGDAILKYGERGEDPCSPDFNSGFFKVIDELNSTTGMYFGHDHINNFIVTYKTPEVDIDFAYGIKSTDRVYYGDSMLGGRVIILKDDHSVEYQHIYHTYAEVE